MLATNATGTSAVNGNVAAAALSLSGNNGVTIAGNVNTTGAVNASSAAGSVTNSGTITTTNADVTLTGATAVNVNGAIAAGTGDVSLTAPVVSTTAAISGAELTVSGSTSVTIGGAATMTGAVSLGGGSVDINAAIAGLTFNASGSTFNSNSSGDLTIGTGTALTFTGDVTIGGDIVTGATGAINVVSDADIVVGAVRLGAPSISLEAGNGATNSVDVNTNSPQITGATSTSRPDSFSFIQGKEIEGQDLPSVARFGDGSDAAILNGMNYLVRSKSGVITLTTGAAATKVQGTNLTLTGGLDITLGTDLTLDSILTNGGGTVKLPASITLTADDATTGFIRFDSDLEVSNALTLRAGEIDFNGNLTPGAGASLTLTSADPATSIRLNDAADTGAGTLDLTAGDLSRLAAGFDSITFGSADHTGTITLAADATFSDRVIFLGTGDLELCADLTTEGEEVIFSTPVVICEDVTVDTTNGGAIATGANVTFGSTIRADDQLAGRDLVLTTGTAGVLS
ncbi:MAG: beta strand repeat-containing protein, partial [bacterium]